MKKFKFCFNLLVMFFSLTSIASEKVDPLLKEIEELHNYANYVEEIGETRLSIEIASHVFIGMPMVCGVAMPLVALTGLTATEVSSVATIILDGAALPADIIGEKEVFTTTKKLWDGIDRASGYGDGSALGEYTFSGMIACRYVVKRYIIARDAYEARFGPYNFEPQHDR